MSTCQGDQHERTGGTLIWQETDGVQFTGKNRSCDQLLEERVDHKLPLTTILLPKRKKKRVRLYFLPDKNKKSKRGKNWVLGRETKDRGWQKKEKKMRKIEQNEIQSRHKGKRVKDS